MEELEMEGEDMATVGELLMKQTEEARTEKILRFLEKMAEEEKDEAAKETIKKAAKAVEDKFSN